MNVTEGVPVAERGHIILSTVALCVLSLALPVMTLQVYDRILPNPSSGTLPVLIAGVSLAVAVEICLRLARAWMIGWNSAVFEQAAASAAMRHLLDADVRAAGARGAGEWLGRFGAIGKIKDFRGGYALMTMTEFCFVPVFLCVIFYIARPLAPIPALLLLVFAAATVWQGRKMHRAIVRRAAVDDRRYNFLIGCLRGIHAIKAFAVERLLARRYEALQARSGLASFEAAEASSASFNAGTCLAHVMMALIVAAGAVFVIRGEITTGALIATLQLSGRLMQPVQRGLVLWAKYQDYTFARKKLDEVFALPQRAAAVVQEELPEAAGKLSARKVSLPGAFKDVSLELVPGEAVALHGAGGRALLDVLSGLYAPEDGEVLIDGLDIRAYAPEELARRVGYLAAEGVIFRGTIRDNISCFGRIPDAQVKAAAALLGVDRDAAKLPSGFDTLLRADGTDQVSRGLRQRIAMARVLAPRPKILLVGEAASAVDRAGYNLVFSLLARLRRHTAMVIVSDDANIAGLAGQRRDIA